MQQHLVFKASAQLHGKLDLILLTMVFMQLRAYPSAKKGHEKVKNATFVPKLHRVDKALQYMIVIICCNNRGQC